MAMVIIGVDITAMVIIVLVRASYHNCNRHRHHNGYHRHGHHRAGQCIISKLQPSSSSQWSSSE
eukprot:11108313-Karenia_brevis.AAC.1